MSACVFSTIEWSVCYWTYIILRRTNNVGSACTIAVIRPLSSAWTASKISVDTTASTVFARLPYCFAVVVTEPKTTTTTKRTTKKEKIVGIVGTRIRRIYRLIGCHTSFKDLLLVRYFSVAAERDRMVLVCGSLLSACLVCIWYVQQ